MIKKCKGKTEFSIVLKFTKRNTVYIVEEIHENSPLEQKKNPHLSSSELTEFSFQLKIQTIREKQRKKSDLLL